MVILYSQVFSYYLYMFHCEPLQKQKINHFRGHCAKLFSPHGVDTIFDNLY